ncbi:hypothetical protein GOP47_0031107 [Adiantum capillus-veneris]|nr:hypothetical protein GOP47_0031107 [Adiantum capillus-veneris]
MGAAEEARGGRAMDETGLYTGCVEDVLVGCSVAAAPTPPPATSSHSGNDRHIAHVINMGRSLLQLTAI